MLSSAAHGTLKPADFDVRVACAMGKKKSKSKKSKSAAPLKPAEPADEELMAEPDAEETALEAQLFGQGGLVRVTTTPLPVPTAAMLPVVEANAAHRETDNVETPSSRARQQAARAAQRRWERHPCVSVSLKVTERLSRQASENDCSASLIFPGAAGLGGDSPALQFGVDGSGGAPNHRRLRGRHRLQLQLQLQLGAPTQPASLPRLLPPRLC